MRPGSSASSVTGVDLILDGGPAHGGPASTVVDCTGARPCHPARGGDPNVYGWPASSMVRVSPTSSDRDSDRRARGDRSPRIRARDSGPGGAT